MLNSTPTESPGTPSAPSWDQRERRCGMGHGTAARLQKFWHETSASSDSDCFSVKISVSHRISSLSFSIFSALPYVLPLLVFFLYFNPPPFRVPTKANRRICRAHRHAAPPPLFSFAAMIIAPPASQGPRPQGRRGPGTARASFARPGGSSWSLLLTLQKWLVITRNTGVDPSLEGHGESRLAR